VPDQVQVVPAGTITTGGEELALDLDKRGYEWVEEQSGASREAAYHGGERNPGSQC
jgi:Fe-S cluster assembly ATPase SufC